MRTDRSSPSALTFARLLGDGPMARVALEAALAQIDAPAFIVSKSATVLYSNTEGRKKVERSRDAMRATLQSALDSLGNPDAAGSALVTSLQAPNLPAYYLVIFRPPATPAATVAYAASLWELTPKQTEVLGLLAEGFSNKTIAVRLNCTERTVETHMTAIFQKSGFDSRTALLAAIVRSKV